MAMGTLFPQDITVALLTVVIVYSLAVLILFWRNNITRYDKTHHAQPLLLLMVLLHILFPFEAGDFYHTMEALHYKDFHAMEPVYERIAMLVGYDYVIFRIVIWGSAFFLFLMTVKRFGLDIYKTVFLLYAMFIGIFDYARASLAMSIFFLGFSFFCRPIRNHRFFSSILGLLVMLCSLPFHTSMAVPLVATVILLVPFNKKTIIAGLVLLIFSVSFLNGLLSMVIDHAIGGDGRLNEQIIGYASQVTEAESYSKLEWIRRWVEYATFFIPVIILGYKFFLESNRPVVPSAILKLYKMAFAIQISAVLTLMVNLGSFILFYRFLFISMLPVTILFSFGRKEGIVSPKLYKAIVVLALMGIYFGYSKMLLGGNLS